MLTLTGSLSPHGDYFRFIPCSCVHSVASGKAERICGYFLQKLICPPKPTKMSGR